MSKNFSISIPEPCHEKWSAMTPNEKGRHCAACQKTVIDFSLMSDEQMIAMFRKTPEQLHCGRFRGDQLNRDYSVPKKRIPWLKYFFQVVIPAFLWGKEARSQGAPVIVRDTVFRLDKPVDVVTAISGTDEIVVRGKVVFQGDNPVAHASVILKGTNRGVAAAADGSFSIRIDRDFSKRPTLEISAVGYATREFELTTLMLTKTSGPGRDSLSIISELIEMENTFVGEIVVVKSRRPAKSKRTKIVGADPVDVKENAIVYPNPVLPGGVLSVKLKKAAGGNCRYSVVDMNGKEVFTGQYELGKNDKVFSLQLPSLIPGPYILLMKIEGGKNESVKFLVNNM